MWERLKSPSNVIIIVLFLVIIVQDIMLRQKGPEVNKITHEVEHIQNNIETQAQESRQEHHTKVTTISKPDGEITKIVEKDEVQTKVEEHSSDKSNTSRDTTTAVTTRTSTLPIWTLGASFAGGLQSPVLKQVEVGRQILGGVYGTISVDTDKRILMGIRYEW